MAGIYIHIPFCKQACFYCNFHFSTLLTYKEKVVAAIAKELFLRKDVLEGQKIETIYFGGGTPSLLSEKEFGLLLETIQKHFDLSNLKEFTVEANPDDIHLPLLKFLKKNNVNRLSIGIQSFDDNHLKMMLGNLWMANYWIDIDQLPTASFNLT
jgi:oxygen-independent coproporphyrinogen-3 oxidase